MMKGFHGSYVRSRNHAIRCCLWCLPKHRENSFCGVPVEVEFRGPRIRHGLQLIDHFREFKAPPLLHLEKHTLERMGYSKNAQSRLTCASFLSRASRTPCFPRPHRIFTATLRRLKTLSALARARFRLHELLREASSSNAWLEENFPGSRAHFCSILDIPKLPTHFPRGIFTATTQNVDH